MMKWIATILVVMALGACAPIGQKQPTKEQGDGYGQGVDANTGEAIGRPE
jgi:hypothetical protein